MKHHASLPCRVAGLVWLAALTLTTSAQSANPPAEPIPLAELGAKAGAQYQGDGLSVTPAPEGARLRCVFQKLEGRVTPEGLWLVSTAEPQTGEQFRVMARAVGREGALQVLPPKGAVTVAGKLARCVRPGLTEEYSVSVDGVRQDFVVTQRPAGDGGLRVELDVTGARAEALAHGARLVLDGSGRNIAYRRLHAVDAEGKELTARMEVTTEARLAVLVDDAAAAYPVRIDPTFSDEDWISMGGLPGAGGNVYATVVDGSGNLYIGGNFTIVGEVLATDVAKWNGSAWSALGSGVNGSVRALAMTGSDLYVGGNFTMAGGKVSAYLARAMGPAAFTSIVPDPSGTQALLTFATAPGASLHLLSSTNLTAWQTNSTVNAIEVTNSVSVNITQPQEFFRLLRLP